MGVLDDYDQNLLDEREYAPMDFDARRAVEAELAERDRREGRRTGRLGAAQESDEGKKKPRKDGDGFQHTTRKESRSIIHFENGNIYR